MENDWDRAIAMEPMMKFFKYEHLPAKLQDISMKFAYLAFEISQEPRTPERTVCLRKLLEAKDCAVRNRLD